jgi:16S rRNA processing protein RimM
MVLKFAGVDSISEAEALVGAWVQVEEAMAVALPEGTYFDHELVGCTIYDASGANLGIVVDVYRIPGNHQLVVRGGRGEYLVPANSDVCREVSITERRIVADLPEGLMDLNG